MMLSARKRDWTPLILVAAMTGMWLVLSSLTGESFFGPSWYNTYTQQALAWRAGLNHLPENIPYLELAVYEGNYYVSFPPVPSLILFPLTFFFGEDTPDHLLVKLYGLGACLMIYHSLKRAGYSRLSGGLLAFLFCFASSLLPMTLNGAVWYHAQMLAFFFTIAAIHLLTRDRPAPALLCYALSVGCRPFHALYALPLFLYFILRKRRAGIAFPSIFRSLLPGIGLGLLVALGLGLYNNARFGNPLEFGHNYLPEFSIQGGVQFSLRHVRENVKTFLWGFPLDIQEGRIQVKPFGYSMLLACPMLLLMLIWFLLDACKKRLYWEKAILLCTCMLHGFLLLLHRTFGGYQLGARYAVDLMPYAFFYLLKSPEKKKIQPGEAVLLVLMFLFTCWGVTQVHI